MIAIPVESDVEEPITTKLFGNAPFFALVDPKTSEKKIISNEGCGNGVHTANFLIAQGATRALYGFLGDGPFHVMHREGTEVYWLGKETMPLDQAIQAALNDSLVRVTLENSSQYLDSGTNNGSCECGCNHA